MTIQIAVINQSGNELPTFATKGSAGMDLRAHLVSPVEIAPGNWEMIPTGLYFEIPMGFEVQIRPRSGLALKHGVTVLNSPGTIDSDYRGEIKVVLINHSKIPFTVNNGERIAQMVVNKHESISWSIKENLTKTERGSGGYGHTGKK
jgi:dUTP pyrophosphatase